MIIVLTKIQLYLLSKFKQRSCPYFLFSLFFWKVSGTIWFIFFQLFSIFFHSMLLRFLYYQINDSTFLYILQIFLCLFIISFCFYSISVALFLFNFYGNIIHNLHIDKKLLYRTHTNILLKILEGNVYCCY